MADLTKQLGMERSGQETQAPVKSAPSIIENVAELGGNIFEALGGAKATRDDRARAAAQREAARRQAEKDAIERENRDAGNFLAESMLTEVAVDTPPPTVTNEPLVPATEEDIQNLGVEEQGAIQEGQAAGREGARYQAAVNQGRMSREQYELKMEGILRAAFAKFPNSKLYVLNEMEKIGIKHPMMTEYRRAMEAEEADIKREQGIEDEYIKAFSEFAPPGTYDNASEAEQIAIGREIVYNRNIIAERRAAAEADRAQEAHDRASTTFGQGQIDRANEAVGDAVSRAIEVEMGVRIGSGIETLNQLSLDPTISDVDRMKQLAPVVENFRVQGYQAVEQTVLKYKSENPEFTDEMADSLRGRLRKRIDDALIPYDPSNPVSFVSANARALKMIQTNSDLAYHEAMPLFAQLSRTMPDAMMREQFIAQVWGDPKIAKALSQELKGIQGLTDGQQTVRMKNALAIIADANTQLRDLAPQEGAVALHDAVGFLDKALPMAISGSNPRATEGALNVYGKLVNAVVDQNPHTDLRALLKGAEYVSHPKLERLIRVGLTGENREFAQLVGDAARAATQQNLISLTQKNPDPYYRVILDIGAGKYIIKPTGKRPRANNTNARFAGLRLGQEMPPPSKEVTAQANLMNQNLKFLMNTNDMEDKMPIANWTRAQQAKFYGTGQLPEGVKTEEAQPDAPSWHENVAKVGKAWADFDVDFSQVPKFDPATMIDSRMGVAGQIEAVENSTGNPNAKNPNSTATGNGQFIESTWMDMIERYRPDLKEGRTKAQILALRGDPQISREMTNNYAQENGRKLAAQGLPVTPTTTYLMHFAGPNDAPKVLRAAPNTPVKDILDPDSYAANDFLQGWTAQQLINWAKKKMGD